MRPKLGKNGLFSKMMIAYSVPYVCFSLILIWHNYQNVHERLQKEFVTNVSQAFSRTAQEVDNKIGIAYDLSDMIRKNNKILEFIDDPYLGDQARFLQTYLDNVLPIVQYATSFSGPNDYSIQLFMRNEELPEAWPFFLQMNHIPSDSPLRMDESVPDEGLWLGPEESAFGLKPLASGRRMHALAVKLYSSSRDLLGYAIVRIAEDSLLSKSEESSAASGGNIAFLTDGRDIVLSTADDDLPDGPAEAALVRARAEAEGHFIDRDYIYFHKHYPPLQQTLVYKVSMEELNGSVRKAIVNQLLIVFASVLFLGITSYLMFKMIFVRLKRIVKIMKHVMSGNFDIRIPDQSQDELGQLAKDFNHLIQRNNELIHSVVMKERSRKEAQIQALQYQINPHFIYNTLDIFRMKLFGEQRYEAADRIADFGKILRYNLSGNTMHSTLGREIDLVSNYLSIQQLSGQAISFEADVPEGMKELPVIKFLLQPIVENCVKYGSRGDGAVTEIRLRCFRQYGEACIEVTDNGKGIPAERAAKLNEGFQAPLDAGLNPADSRGSIGLENINARLRLYYGDGYYLRMDSEESRYTKVTIRLPLAGKEYDHVQAVNRG